MAEEKTWQHRIKEATDAISRPFVESISYDWRMYKQDIAGSIAHATMLAKVGLITDADRDAIVKGLKQIESEIDRDGQKWMGFKDEFEDIHLCIEMELTTRIGEPGRRLHTGRSRNDQVATDLAMWIRVVAWQLHRQTVEMQFALVSLAERSANTVMPAFTHLQRAQPINAAAEPIAWAEQFKTDELMLHQARLVANKCLPLGSGAIAGSSLPLDPDVTRQCLESLSPVEEGSVYSFRGSPSSSIEHTASRDAACALLFACAMISQHLSRWAEQWIIYMSTEFQFIKIADRFTTSSSMMPQKRNPDMLELIRGRCGNVYGDLFALMTILKGLPIGYNRDLQEDKRIVFRAYDTVSQCLTMATAIVNSASYNKEVIEPTLDRGFLDATSLAEYMVTKGIPFRTAHNIVGMLVARCEETKRYKLAQLSVDEINEAVAKEKVSVKLTDDVYTCLGAANVVKRYKSAGAAGGEPLQKQLDEWKKRLGLE